MLIVQLTQINNYIFNDIALTYNLSFKKKIFYAYYKQLKMCFTKAEIILRHVHRIYVDYVALLQQTQK